MKRSVRKGNHWRRLGRWFMFSEMLLL